MRKELLLGVLGAVALSIGLLGVAPEADAAAYIKFDGVDGEAQDKDHAAWSDLLSVQQSITRSSEGASTRARGSAVLSDIVVVKELDKSSPKLAESVATGKVFPKVEIHLTASYADSGRVTYYAYELKNVMVSSYSISANGQTDEIPMEEISFNFEEIKVTYTEYDNKGKSKGNVEYAWKVEEGK